jgi:hypothetical protein
MSPATEVIGICRRTLRRDLSRRASDAYVDVLAGLIARRRVGALAPLRALPALLVRPLCAGTRDRTDGSDGRGLLGRRADRVNRVHQEPSERAASRAAMTSS